MSKNIFNGFVLAGGKSKRMGTDKAFLVFREKPMLQHMIDFLSPFCNKVFISGNNSEFASFNVNIIPDQFVNCGPLGGLFTALSYSDAEWNLITGVDTPLLENELIYLLESNLGNADCVVPSHRFGVEPLVAFYHRNSLSIIEESINTGDYKLNNLLSKLETRYVDCNALIEKYPGLFLNINRPEDYNLINQNTPPSR